MEGLRLQESVERYAFRKADSNLQKYLQDKAKVKVAQQELRNMHPKEPT